MTINEFEIRTRLKEIRLRLGMTESDVANKLGKSYNSYVHRIENGEKKLSIEIINELAGVYAISPAELFVGAQKSLNLKKDFFSRAEYRADSRKLSNEAKSNIKSLLPFLRKIGKALKQLDDRALQLSDFIQQKKPQNQFQAKKIGKEAAQAFRKKFNLGINPITDIQQLIWIYAKIPICSVNLDRDCWGYYSRDQFDNPLIIYSSSHNYLERNVFTIAHEFGHHLFANNEGRIDFENANDDNSLSEILANSFAQELLVPSEALNRIFEDTGFDNLEILEAKHVVPLAKFFNVSFRMMSYVLYLQNKIKLNTYNELKGISKNQLTELKYFDKKEAIENKSIEEYLKEVVARGVRKGAINKLVASEILNIPSQKVEELL